MAYSARNTENTDSAMGGRDAFLEDKLEQLDFHGKVKKGFVDGKPIKDWVTDAWDEWSRLSDGERTGWEEKAEELNRMSGHAKEVRSPTGFPQYGLRGGHYHTEPPSQEELQSKHPEMFQLDPTLKEGDTRKLHGSIEAEKKDGKVFLTDAGARRRNKQVKDWNTVPSDDPQAVSREEQDEEAYWNNTPQAPYQGPSRRSSAQPPAPQTKGVPIERPRGTPQAQPEPSQSLQQDMAPEDESSYYTPGQALSEFGRQMAPLFKGHRGHGRRGKTWQGPAINPIPGSPGSSTQQRIRNSGSPFAVKRNPFRVEDLLYRT